MYHLPRPRELMQCFGALLSSNFCLNFRCKVHKYLRLKREERNMHWKTKEKENLVKLPFTVPFFRIFTVTPFYVSKL